MPLMPCLRYALMLLMPLRFDAAAMPRRHAYTLPPIHFDAGVAADIAAITPLSLPYAAAALCRRLLLPDFAIIDAAILPRCLSERCHYDITRYRARDFVTLQARRIAP